MGTAGMYIPLLLKLTPMEFFYVWAPEGEFLRILSTVTWQNVSKL